MSLDLGPVEPASAAAWSEWAQEMLAELRADPASRVTVPVEVLDEVDNYLERWMPGNVTMEETLQWHAELHADELEYLVHAFFTLDARLLPDVQPGEQCRVSDEARVFYLVLVRALLHALEMESPGRAAYVDQLRSFWPSAGEAS